MSEPSTYPGTPRWVKLSVAVTLTIVVLGAVGLHIASGGQHGPGRHGQAGHATTTVRTASGGAP